MTKAINDGDRLSRQFYSKEGMERLRECGKRSAQMERARWVEAVPGKHSVRKLVRADAVKAIRSIPDLLERAKFVSGAIVAFAKVAGIPSNTDIRGKHTGMPGAFVNTRLTLDDQSYNIVAPMGKETAARFIGDAVMYARRYGKSKRR